MVIKTMVHLHGWLVRYAVNEVSSEEVELPDGSVIADVMEHYGFEKGEIGVIIVEGRFAAKDSLVEHDMDIHFYPVFAGG
jgi:sulfur carrier protein ThiS